MLEDHLHGATLCQGPFGHGSSGDIFTLPQDLQLVAVSRPTTTLLRWTSHTQILQRARQSRPGEPQRYGVVCPGIALFPASPGKRIVLP